MPAKLSSPISPNCMFSFLFMNIAHLYAKYRQKNKLLADYCDSSTMFICLSETFLHEGILDSEVLIPGFIIVRSDRVSRPGGGVCLYLRKNLIYKICLKYSNPVCDLLIVKILSPDLIIILVYRPPSSPLSDFDDIIAKTREFILSLPAPLPNIILLGDFNMPEVIWDNPHAYNPFWLQTTQPTSTADSSCCANCVEPPHPQQWGPDLPFFGHAGHADPLDGWCCCSQKRVMSRPIQVQQL